MMAANKDSYRTVDQRRDIGLAARARVPHASHEGWTPAPHRWDPVALLEDQDKTREADLVPVRHARMSVSPFTFYRGTAKIMAADLAASPRAGLDVQLCGDAHLSNFGLYASPERALVFDLNDFDETLPGPFEYDVKRMAASFTIAARNNGFSPDEIRSVTRASVAAYRKAMAGFAGLDTMDVWYARLAEQEIMKGIRQTAAIASTKGQGKAAKEAVKRAAKIGGKAHTRSSLQALSKLGEYVDGQYRIVSQPPLVVPARELADMYGISAEQLTEVIDRQFRSYRPTLQADRRGLLERFKIIDVARKVVGVGSVGTRAFIVLLRGRDEADPLFLQIKEATASVLEDHLPESRFRNPGERVVQGQRRMQAASDIFLGWSKGVQEGYFYYWRQLRDMKGSIDVESMAPLGLEFYGGICGWTLARAHARSGDPVAIAAYLGDGKGFDRAITDFSARYADQNELDYQQFTAAIQSGRLEASDEATQVGASPD
jgi:uncharacterized protein (DUF2252 family)